MIKPHRIAILINQTLELPAWEIESIKKVRDSGLATIETFIISGYPSEMKEGFSLRLFQKFENWWFGSMPDAFRKSSVKNEFPGVRIIDTRDEKKISELDLDLIYSSCLISHSREAEFYAKYGLWYINFGSAEYVGSEPVGFWEVMNDTTEIGSSLNVKLPSEGVITVYQGTTTTVPYSVKNTFNSIAWKASSFFQYRLHELSQSGGELFFRKYKNQKRLLPEESYKIFKPPGSVKLIGLFTRNVFRYIINKFTQTFSKKRFTLLFSQQEFKIPEIDFSKFTPLKLPDGVFWADPFLVQKDQKNYIFFEEYVYKKNKAHISVLEIKSDGSNSDPTIILDKPYHLSYPFVFQVDNVYYMVPDSNSNKTVELYKCTQFPDKWEFVENLMEDISLIDSTLLYYENKWWLFGNNPANSFTSTNDQLFLYSSENLFSSTWKPHPQNPVATLISNCRPAGKIFQLAGKLYRPAQNNSSKQYGYGIKINEIEVLNETEYREKEMFEIRPDKTNQLSAVHTINFINNLIVIDGIV